MEQETKTLNIEEIRQEAKREVIHDVETAMSKINYEPQSDWNNFCVEMVNIKRKHLTLKLGPNKTIDHIYNELEMMHRTIEIYMRELLDKTGK